MGSYDKNYIGNGNHQDYYDDNDDGEEEDGEEEDGEEDNDKEDDDGDDDDQHNSSSGRFSGRRQMRCRAALPPWC